MHATIQKPIEEIIGYFWPGEKVFVVGCDNCAAKCHSGGIPETEEMANRLKALGRLEQIRDYIPPKRSSRWSRPRSLTLAEGATTFRSLAGEVTVASHD